MNFRQPTGSQSGWVRYSTIALIFFIVAEIILFGWLLVRTATAPTTVTTVKQTNQPKTGKPSVQTKVMLDGLSHVWGMAFLPTGELLFTERGGTLSRLDGAKKQQIAQIPDVKADGGEGGLLGMAVDPKFSQNNYLYTCFNSTSGDIRVVRWTLTADLTTLTGRKNIVTGIVANLISGRHSGCQVAFGPDGYLWIGTGDSGQNLKPQSPQDPMSLGGKILRVDREGQAAPGNFTAPYDTRIYSYGHRNTQGLAFFSRPINGVVGVSAEHGSTVDDELNPLKPGNFGWAPPDGPYDESVPMTDKTRFPSAIDALWTSGSPTQAPSGVAIISGTAWRDWNGAVAMAMLKDEHLKILPLDKDLKVGDEAVLLNGSDGRLRSVIAGPDGSLYVGTSNGTNDKIIRLTPQ